MKAAPVFLVLVGLALVGAGLAWHPGHAGGGKPLVTPPPRPPSDRRSVTLEFAPGYTWAVDVAVAGSPASIAAVKAVRYPLGPHPLGASGIIVRVLIDGEPVYTGYAAEGSDGLYHALASVPGKFVDGRPHNVTVLVWG
ncbi:MAG: hypothetical protein GSR80_000038 [Desulfurococcales archaeon]|nr:hypothetical protein [Desulfurococcales archaeon]